MDDVLDFLVSGNSKEEVEYVAILAQKSARVKLEY
jgi:hypothetical protein